MSEPELLTVKETAALMRLDRNTVYELVRTNQIPHVRLGRSIRIPRQALLQHLERAALEAVSGA